MKFLKEKIVFVGIIAVLAVGLTLVKLDGRPKVQPAPPSLPDLAPSAQRLAPAPSATQLAATGPASSIQSMLVTAIKKSAPPITDPYKGVAPVEAVTTQPASSQPLDPATALVEPQADGTLLVDHAYRLVGSGTPEDPYIVRWDMLISARDTFDPASGQWQVPGRLKMLDGKSVQIRGYFAIPVITPTSDRLLLTWNMIDACHGVTPKAYQAVEVKLLTPMEVHPHTLEIMTIAGKFRLDPSLRTGWSMVMYMLDDARLVAIDGPR